MKNKALVFALVLIAGLAAIVYGQNSPQSNATLTQPTQSLYFVTPISATAAVNNQTTLTIPAPAAGLYNYICTLGFDVTEDGTATAINNSVTTSTNFNSFAFQMSAEDVAQKVFQKFYKFGDPATGCAKSTAAATATTFVSPTAVANAAFAWQATYFQAP